MFAYQRAGLVLGRGRTDATPEETRELQRHLRALGYLKGPIDGVFGKLTEAAVQALTHDLLHNDGHGSDGHAPVAVSSFNQGRVAAVVAEVDQRLAACVADLMGEPDYPKVPFSPTPASANAAVRKEVKALDSSKVPMQFLCGMFVQESGFRHFGEPVNGHEDGFVVLGLDHNEPTKPFAVTSRGYGVGQFTFFHHPPTETEMTDFVETPSRNVTKAIAELREKFDSFVNGPSGTADDRRAEVGSGPLRLCKFTSTDPRFLRDCLTCLADAGSTTIESGVTRWYERPAGNTVPEAGVYRPTKNYAVADYDGVPIRKNIPCDWPYAVRRYNGGGIASYHYQTRVLLHMLGR